MTNSEVYEYKLQKNISMIRDGLSLLSVTYMYDAVTYRQASFPGCSRTWGNTTDVQPMFQTYSQLCKFNIRHLITKQLKHLYYLHCHFFTLVDFNSA